MQQIEELALAVQADREAAFLRSVDTRDLTLDEVLNVPMMEWNWSAMNQNQLTASEALDRSFRMKEAERNAIFEEILTGELKTLNTTLEFLLEENFSYGYLILAEVVRLQTILNLKRLGASEEIKQLCYFI